MSQDAQSTRPGQATFAGWLIIGGSVILVITAWQRIAGLNSLEVREELSTVLSEPPLSDTGLTLSGLTTAVRIGSMMAAAAATAAAILGYHALKRSTSARIALTCLAPLVLIGGFATAGLFAPFVVVGVVMLWLSPTTDWFAGRPWVNKTVPPPADPERPDPFAEPSGGSDAVQPPPAEQTFGAPAQATPAAATAVAEYGAPPSHNRAPRPAALGWACGLVWVMSGLVSGMMLLMSLVLAVAREQLFEEFERQQPDFDFQGLSQSEIVAGVFAMTGFVVVWCLIAVVFAIFAFRGAEWARIALLVSSVMVVGVSAVGMIANPLLIVLVAAGAVTAWLLLRPEVVAWCRGRGPANR